MSQDGEQEAVEAPVPETPEKRPSLGTLSERSPSGVGRGSTAEALPERSSLRAARQIAFAILVNCYRSITRGFVIAADDTGKKTKGGDKKSDGKNTQGGDAGGTGSGGTGGGGTGGGGGPDDDDDDDDGGGDD